MHTSSTSFAVVSAAQASPALRIQQDPRQPQRLRLSGSFGEVCRALDALSNAERQSPSPHPLFGLLAH